jgi:D-sedoheptulose 7-phosphate isomerase
MNRKRSEVALIEELIQRYPVLGGCEASLRQAAGMLVGAIDNGGKIMICGNGGSAADADHIVGELMKGFLRTRPLPQYLLDQFERIGGDLGLQIGKRLQGGIPALSLSAHVALGTAFGNDVDPSLVYAQQLSVLAHPGDLLWGLSTSGNSANIVAACITAKVFSIPTLVLTGESESRLSGLADVCIRVPGTDTYKIQELHLPVYHTLCRVLEEHRFGEESDSFELNQERE